MLLADVATKLPNTPPLLHGELERGAELAPTVPQLLHWSDAAGDHAQQSRHGSS